MYISTDFPLRYDIVFNGRLVIPSTVCFTKLRQCRVS